MFRTILVNLIFVFQVALPSGFAEAADKIHAQHFESQTAQPAYLILASNSECTKACESDYFRCAKRGDLKQCAEARAVCVRLCKKAS